MYTPYSQLISNTSAWSHDIRCEPSWRSAVLVWSPCWERSCLTFTRLIIRRFGFSWRLKCDFSSASLQLLLRLSPVSVVKVDLCSFMNVSEVRSRSSERGEQLMLAHHPQRRTGYLPTLHSRTAAGRLTPSYILPLFLKFLWAFLLKFCVSQYGCNYFAGHFWYF